MKTKEEIVNDMHERYKQCCCVFVIDYKGLCARDVSVLRGELVTGCNSRFVVMKNTLNKISLKGTPFEGISNLKGQCGVILSNDILKASKVVNRFCFADKKVGFVTCLCNGEVYDEKHVKELAALPSFEVVRSMLLRTIKSAALSIVRVIAEHAKKNDGSQR